MRRPAARVLRCSSFVLASICAACSSIIGPDLPTTPAALFDRVWSDLDLHYSLFVVKQINWDSLGAVYRPRAVAAQSEDELSATIAGMLSKLQDGHVEWRGRQVGSPPSERPFEPVFTPPYVYMEESFKSGVSYGVGASATVGYIAIRSFEGNGWLPDIDLALAALTGANTIIIDVRNNGGGLLENATGAAGRFADRATTVAYVRYRNGPAHSDFTSPIAQVVHPAGSRRFLKRVYLLTGRSTISAAELFVLSMRALGHTTVVGDTTAGETGSPWTRELQNGWSYQFPESIEYALDGHEFEDVGLPPDVPVVSSSSQTSNGVDAPLARAIALASTRAP
jgi:carboxyl-terminal processing protease